MFNEMTTTTTLGRTASQQLNAASTEVAQMFMTDHVLCSTNTDEDYNEFREAYSDNAKLNELLMAYIGQTIQNVDLSFLSDSDDEEIIKLMKSQQSKRSHTKKKDMTPQSYATVVAGAVGEILCRRALGKGMPNTTRKGGGSFIMHDDATIADIAQHDQGELVRLIRNAQARKTLMKKKGLEGSDEWNELIAYIDFMVSYRDSSRSTRTTTVVEPAWADDVKMMMTEAGDLSKLKAAEARGLLMAIAEAMGINPVETTNDDVEIEVAE